VRILRRIKESAAVSAHPALGHRPGKSANQSKRENTPRFYPARSENNSTAALFNACDAENFRAIHRSSPTTP
ncbi:MAG: hypothetical protein OXF79_26120, partial [Chloroflexi bacterium]|nr:hypothetical protein [Chloroflexota bacterium]